MTDIQRIKPEPVPAIHPLPEYLADGQRLGLYQDTKEVFQVPWMGVVTMAYAHYPHFYDTLWRGLRDLCASGPFVTACRHNRAFVESMAAGLNPPAIDTRLADLGYAPREVGEIRRMIETFSHGNQAYVVLATAARYLMEGGEMAGPTETGAAPRYPGRHAPEYAVPFVLMEPHHADPATRTVYEDIKQALGLPFVNTDYRALARWPSYWSTAWNDLRAVPGTPEHESICLAFHERCVEQVAATLPNPSKLTSRTLWDAAERDGAREEIRDVCRLFQWLLPGLITNVAYLRAQFQDT